MKITSIRAPDSLKKNFLGFFFSIFTVKISHPPSFSKANARLFHNPSSPPPYYSVAATGQGLLLHAPHTTTTSSNSIPAKNVLESAEELAARFNGLTTKQGQSSDFSTGNIHTGKNEMNKKKEE